VAVASGHRIGALEAGWPLPETAGILFATPGDLLRSVRGSRISLEELQSVVVDGFGSLSTQERETLRTLLESTPRDAQKVLMAQPLTEEAEAFGKAHLSRAVHLPPKAAQAEGGDEPPRRGEVAYRIVGEEKEEGVLQTVASILDEGGHHVLLFFRTADQAADLGDVLALRGFGLGAPGDPDVPVWLAVDELETRKLMDEWPDADAFVSVSVDVPPGPDSLDRRHGGGEAGLVLVRARELPHLRYTARTTGYRLVPAKEPVPTRVSGELTLLRHRVSRALKEAELGPFHLALEPLFDEYAPAEVAAAVLFLLERDRGGGKEPPTREKETAPPGSPPPRTWLRLFIAVGEKDGVGPGDLLGAIAGEAGVEGSQVGKIEIRETYSLVEVASGVADRIIRKLNGTTIRGRAVRVDHDRGGPRRRGGPSGRSRRKPGGDAPPDS
jgi:ATP-dependent RNA helicase DeaD